MTNDNAECEFILYACPIGLLADQLDQYFRSSLACCGRNSAHNYMPHCTLTGFFRDRETAIPLYIRSIAAALQLWQPYPQPALSVTNMTFRSDWHGLELESSWMRSFVATFAEIAHSPTRQESLRLKDWLHLSLAYGFAPEHSQCLLQLAQSHVHWSASVSWQLRFYQRHLDRSWICHQSWSLSGSSPFSIK